MARQIKVARGSRFLCKCGCGSRKTSPRRRYAPGHDSRSGRRRLFWMREKVTPAALERQARRDARRGVFDCVWIRR